MYLNKSQGVLFGSANQAARKQTLYHNNISGSQNGNAGKNSSVGVNPAGANAANNAGRTGGNGIRTVGGDLRAIKRMLTQGGQKNQNALFGGNIVDQSMSYADSLRASRTKAKDTSLQLKKMKYNFKSLSTKILRSKTSSSAKQVASEARREVLKLKRQLKSGEYDEEEIQSAITHAQAMERVAKKKAAHLLEEEMVKVTGGPCAAELEEKEDQKDSSKEEALEDAIAEFEGGNASDQEWDMAQERTAALQEQMQAYQEMAQFQMEQLQEEMAARMEEMQRAMEEMTQNLQEEAAASSEDMMSELMDEMSESMEEMLENSGLEELAESMFTTAEVEVDPADYKMMKIKHRSEEMKALAKADAEYLKDMFDRLEKMKGGSGLQSPMGGGHSAGGFSGMPSGGIVVSAGGGDAIRVTPMPDSTSSHMPDIDPVSLPGGGGAPGADGGVSLSGSVDIFL